MDLREAFDRSVDLHPDRTALVTREREYSYQELREEVKGVAGKLQHLGFNRDKIAFSASNSADTLITVLGIWYSGNVSVHINPRIEAEELPYYLEDSGAQAFLFDRKVEKKFNEIDNISPDFVSRIRDMDRTGFPVNKNSQLDQKLCSLTYTSGTTGKPKGVPYRHTRLLHGSMILVIEAQEARDLDIAIRDEVQERLKAEQPRPFDDETIERFIESEPWEDDRHAVIYPLYHVSGTNPSFATLLAGGTLVLSDRDTDKIVEVMEQQDITLSGGVPAQLEELTEKVRDGEFDSSTLEYIHTAGGLLTDEVREKIVDTLTDNLCHEYASSETLEMSYSLDNSGSLGYPTCLQNLKVVKPGTLEKVDVGEKGEVVVNTDNPTVFQGYWNKPEKTDESIQNGWYRTGDLARFDEEGRLWFEGRADNLIVSGGENISPARVENALVKHPELEKAGVIGVEDSRWGQKVVAFIQGDAGSEELDKHLRESELADFKKPKEYIRIDEMPVKETSGVDRKKLEERYNQQDL